jgi:hypothetical protein
MSKRKPNLGDIVQIRTSKGYAYAQLTHKHHMFGYLLRILPGFFAEPVTDFAPLVMEPELYHAFVFKDDLFQPPVAMIVGNAPVPERSRALPLFRNGIRNPATGRVDDWWLWDGRKEWRIGELREDQRTLSLLEILNSDILRKRIENGSMPANEM